MGTLPVPELVAHRGYAVRYCENTLPAVDAALHAGACYIEIDVQLTADRVPVLLHDVDLQRLAGDPRHVTRIDWNSLQAVQLPADGSGVNPVSGATRIASLQEVADRLRDWPRVHCFVELKEESIDVFGRDVVLAAVLPVLAPLRSRAIVISFDADILMQMPSPRPFRVGWVIREWSSASHERARALAPEYLFCDHRKMPVDRDDLWHGDWRWALYEITDPAQALAWSRRGVDLIETMDIGAMLAHPVLRTRACPGD